MRNIISLIRLFTTASLAVVLFKVLSWLIAPVGSFLDTWISDSVTVLSGIFCVIFTIAVECIRRIDNAKNKKPEIDVKFVEALQQQRLDNMKTTNEAANRRAGDLSKQVSKLTEENYKQRLQIEQLNYDYKQLLDKYDIAVKASNNSEKL